jgi:hypothetical protein
MQAFDIELCDATVSGRVSELSHVLTAQCSLFSTKLSLGDTRRAIHIDGAALQGSGRRMVAGGAVGVGMVPQRTAGIM